MYITIRMCVLLSALLAGNLVKGDDALDIESTSEELAPLTLDEPKAVDPDLNEKLAAAMDDFHAAADIAEKQPAQDTAKTSQIHLKMAEVLDEILDLLDTTDAVYYFLSAHGFDTIIAPHLEIDHAQLRSRLMQLIKALFDIAPTTTKALVPSRILDQLLDIFEKDENASVKAQVVELLSLWLPENPQAQARVMKMKGLEPFYAQLSKLDTPAIGAVLELFNRIVSEHEAARVNRIQKSKADYVALRLYQQIGLLERISTPPVCNGLLNVLGEMWAVSKGGREVLPSLFNLLRTIRPHCFTVYRGREQATVLLTQMAEFVQNPGNKEYFDQLHANVTELMEFFNDFIDQVTVLQREEL